MNTTCGVCIKYKSAHLKYSSLEQQLIAGSKIVSLIIFFSFIMVISNILLTM